jgi:uncharacterized protein YihD (DUF1040 family)
MRDINRIDRILKLIEKTWKKYPDLRLGQLLVNANGKFENNPFYFEDDSWEDDFTKWIEGR